MFNEKLKFAIDNYNCLWIDGSEDDAFITLERPLYPVEYDNRREVTLDTDDERIISEYFANQRNKTKRRADHRPVKQKIPTNQDYYQVCHEFMMEILSYPISEDDLKIKTIGAMFEYDLTKFVHYVPDANYVQYCNYLQSVILPCVRTRFKHGVGRCTVNSDRFMMLAAMLPPNELIEVGKARREKYIIQSFADNDSIVKMAEKLQENEDAIDHSSVEHIASAVYTNIMALDKIDLEPLIRKVNTVEKELDKSVKSLQRFNDYNKNNSAKLNQAIKAYDEFIATHVEQKDLIDEVKRMFDYQVMEGQFITFLNRYHKRMTYDIRALELGTCKIALDSIIESVDRCNYRIALEEPFWSHSVYNSIDLVMYYWLSHNENSDMIIYFDDSDRTCQYDADPDLVRLIFKGGSIPSGRSVIRLTSCSLDNIAYICDAIYRDNGRHSIGFQFHNMKYINIVSQKCATRRIVDARMLRSLSETIDRSIELESEIKYCRRRIREYNAGLDSYKLDVSNSRSQLSKAKKAYEQARNKQQELTVDINCHIIELECIFGIHLC